MEVERDTGLQQAFRMVSAMEGVTDRSTRVSMWRAALRYRARDKASDAQEPILARALL